MSTSASPMTPKVVRRKASFEGVVKHLTDLAVTISTDEVKPNLDVFNGRVRDEEYIIQVQYFANSFWPYLYLTLFCLLYLTLFALSSL